MAIKSKDLNRQQTYCNDWRNVVRKKLVCTGKRIALLAFLFVSFTGSFVVHAETEVESWYLQFNIGTAKPDYPGDVGDFNRRDSIALDVIGVYVPLSDKLIAGANFHVIGDTFWFDNKMIETFQEFLAASGKYYIKGIGSGVYVRGDIGMARMNLRLDDYSPSSGTTVGSRTIVDSTSDWGLGILLGVGYAFPVFNDTQLLGELKMTSFDIDGDKVNNLSASIGFMW